jgi:hypothetical protein
MEGAVRSGYLAAEKLARAATAGTGRMRFVSADMRASGLMRFFDQSLTIAATPDAKD